MPFQAFFVIRLVFGANLFQIDKLVSTSVLVIPNRIHFRAVSRPLVSIHFKVPQVPGVI